MTRRFLVALVLVGTALCLPASYKIYLVNDTVITADDKPVIRDGIAYFEKAGMALYLPVDQIDLVKTEKGGALLAVQPEGAAAKRATRNIGEDQLEEIRKRSRLANEGEFRKPVVEEGAEGAEGAPPPTLGVAPAPAGANERTQLQGQVSALTTQRGDLQKRMVDLQSQMGSLRDRYNTSTQQADKSTIQSQIDGVQSQMDGTRSQMSTVDASLADAQQRLANLPPVVIEVGK